MKLWNVRGRTWGLATNARVYGVGLGSYGPNQNCFIIPIKGREEEVRENDWGILPSLQQKPMLAANHDPSPGVIVLLTTFNRIGKALGQIFAVDDGTLSNIVSIGYGIGGTPNGSVTWEEALVQVKGEATFFLQQVGPPDALLHVSENGQVVYKEVAPNEVQYHLNGDLVRIDDPRIARWKAGNQQKG